MVLGAPEENITSPAEQVPGVDEDSCHSHGNPQTQKRGPCGPREALVGEV